MLVAASAMAFASCSNDNTNDTPMLPSVEVSVTATTADVKSVTKSHFGDYNESAKTYPTLWSGTEAWAVSVNTARTTAGDITFSDDKTSANASVKFNSAPQAIDGAYTLYAISPSTAYSSHSVANDYIRFNIPASQTPNEASCDEAAQVLIAQSEPMTTLSGFNVAFKHAAAYVKFSFSNVAEGGNVTGVSIKSEDVALAGRLEYTPSTKSVALYDKEAYEINLSTTSTTDLWFACAPAAVEGKVLTFTISTDKGPLSKNVTMPGDFEVGSVKTFTIDMNGIDYPVVEDGVEYHLVTSLADIIEGEYVIVHNEETKGACVLTNASATSAGPAYISLNTKAIVGDGVLTNVDDSIKWIFTGDNTSMKVQSYADNTLYLSTISDNNGIRIKADDSHTWRFTESANGGEYSMQNITTNRFCGIYKSGENWRSYTSVESNYYGTTANGTKGAYLTLYKRYTTDPVIIASNIEAVADGGEGEAAYSVKNMTDDVVASTTTEWLTIVSTSAGTIIYSAEANNTGVTRQGEIILTSAGAGISKIITVSQAAASTGDDEANKDITLVFNTTDYTESVNSYTTTWKHTYGDYTYSIVNFSNNRKGWDYIKCGRSGNASVASINTTFAIPWSVANVTVTVDAVTTSKINSTSLVVATDADFSNIVETVTASISKGDVVYTISNPGANYYYKLVYDCASGSSNGLVTISKVVYTAN